MTDIATAMHYCREHNTRFFRNEKIDAKTGESSVWYSHKKADGTGFCVEGKQQQLSLIPQEVLSPIKDNKEQKMLICNAMNNAVALACNGKIEVKEVEVYFKKLLTGLTQATI